MFFKPKDKNQSEDLNRKVEEFKKWWQDQSQSVSTERSDFKKNKSSERSSDSSFVYSDEMQ
jgi:hypothetical protein